MRVHENPAVDEQFLFAKELTKQSYRSRFRIGNVMLFYIKLGVSIILSMELHTLFNPVVTYSSIFITILKVFSFLIDFF